jgi:hypothetical protein
MAQQDPAVTENILAGLNKIPNPGRVNFAIEPPVPVQMPIARELPKQHVTPFNDIAKQLDPMLPQADYDKMREAYFFSIVAPTLDKKKVDVSATYADFKRQTQRPPLLTPAGRLLTQVGVGATAAAKELVAPLTGVSSTAKQAYGSLEQGEKKLDEVANREGMNIGLAKVMGTLTGGAVPLTASYLATGPIASALIPVQAMKMSKALTLANRVLHGGMAFATLQYAREQEPGQRLIAGLYGFGEGALMDGVLGLPGLLAKRTGAPLPVAERLAAHVAQGGAVPDVVDKAAKEAVEDMIETARKEARPAFVTNDGAVRGVRMHVSDAKGVVREIPVKWGTERIAVDELEKVIAKGGQLEGITAHPLDSTAREHLLEEIAKRSREKYDWVKEVRTAVGDANETAAKLTESGIPATATSESTVQMKGVPTIAEALPEGVTFLGVQDTKGNGPNFNIYNLKLPNGVTTTFSVKAGEDIATKAEMVRKKWAASSELSTMLKGEGKLTTPQAVDILTKAGFKVNDQNIARLQEMGEAEFTRLTTITERTTAAGVENPGVMDEAIRKGELKARFMQRVPLSERERLFHATETKPDVIESILDVGITEGADVTTGNQMGAFTSPNFEQTARNFPWSEAAEGKVIFEVNAPEGAERITRRIRGISKQFEVIFPEGVPRKNISKAYIIAPNPDLIARAKKNLAKEIANKTIWRDYAAERLTYFDNVGEQFEGVKKILEERGVPYEIVPSYEALPEFRRERGLRYRSDLGGESGGVPGQTFIPNPTRVSINVRPHRVGISVPPAGVEALYNLPGTRGVEFDRWQEMFASDSPLASQISQKIKDSSADIPGIIIERGTKRNILWHELFHAGHASMGIGEDFSFVAKMLSSGKRFDEDAATNLFSIAQGLKEIPTYKNYDQSRLLNEAYTFASEAVRFGDKHLLGMLAEMDTDVDYVIDAVNRTSIKLLDMAATKLDSVGVRIQQRRLEDLVRRSDVNVTYQLHRSALYDDAIPYWDTAMQKWALKDGTTGAKFYASLEDLHDSIATRDQALDMYPGTSFYAEQMGVRGPFKQGGPPKSPPMPNEPFDTNWKKTGWTAISGLFRPLLPWAASAHMKINSLVPGGTYIPLFETVKKIDHAIHMSDDWLAGWKEKLGKELAGPKTERLHDWFEALASYDTQFNITSVKSDTTAFTPSTFKNVVTPGGVETRMESGGPFTPTTENIFSIKSLDEKKLAALKFTPAERAQLERFAVRLREFQEETKIPVFEYLNKFYGRLRDNAWQPDAVWGVSSSPQSAGFWEGATRYGNGNFDPTDTHLGRFTNWLLRQGLEKKFTGPPVKELEAIVSRKSMDGKYILGPLRWPLQNYVNYVKGIPDTSQQILNAAVGTFSENMAMRFKQLNKTLPAAMQLPEEFSSPQTLMAKWMQLSYAAGIGLRPALVVRDFMASFITSLPVLGPVKFFKGMAKTLTRDGFKAAEDAGALLKAQNIGEMYGDIFHDIPPGSDRSYMQRLAHTMLAPARWGNNATRALTYNAVYDDALAAVESLRTGRIDAGQFLRETSLWAHDEPTNTLILKQVMDATVPAENIAQQIGREITDLTGWPYRRGTQPAMMRTGLGRIFGQYGSWPINYLDFMARLAGKMGNPTFRVDAVRAASWWAAANFASSVAMEKGVGIEASNWLYGGPAGYTGGPQLQLVQDLMESMEESDKGREARRRVISTPLNFFPGSVEMRSIITAIERGETDKPEGLIRALGFRPVEELNRDPDLQEWLLYESGFKQLSKKKK